jgi:hypothetical protein
MKKKANDRGVPEDEMTLARMLAETGHRGLQWTDGEWFRDDYGLATTKKSAVSCCALGALTLIRKVRHERLTVQSKFGGVAYGNDVATRWSVDREDLGESLGWAFRQAMTVSK